MVVPAAVWCETATHPLTVLLLESNQQKPLEEGGSKQLSKQTKRQLNNREKPGSTRIKSDQTKPKQAKRQLNNREKPG